MRIVTGGAPGNSLADNWSAMRDDPHLAAPCRPSDEPAFAELLNFEPRSKALAKRQAKAARVPLVTPCGPPRTPCPLPDPIVFLRQQLRIAVPETPCPPAPPLSDTLRRAWRAENNHVKSRSGEDTRNA